MTIRLSVDRARWWAHVTDVAEQIDGLVPVVKGNGYGFGRDGLAIAAVELSPLLAVGTVHELAGPAGAVHTDRPHAHAARRPSPPNRCSRSATAPTSTPCAGGAVV